MEDWGGGWRWVDVNGYICCIGTAISIRSSNGISCGCGWACSYGAASS